MARKKSGKKVGKRGYLPGSTCYGACIRPGAATTRTGFGAAATTTGFGATAVDFNLSSGPSATTASGFGGTPTFADFGTPVATSTNTFGGLGLPTSAASTTVTVFNTTSFMFNTVTFGFETPTSATTLSAATALSSENLQGFSSTTTTQPGGLQFGGGPVTAVAAAPSLWSAVMTASGLQFVHLKTSAESPFSTATEPGLGEQSTAEGEKEPMEEAAVPIGGEHVAIQDEDAQICENVNEDTPEGELATEDNSGPIVDQPDFIVRFLDEE